MIFHHDPHRETLDLSHSLIGHSGDETLCYKTVNGQQVQLSRYLPPAFDPGRRYPALFLIHGGAWYSRMIFPDQPDWQGDYLGFLARYFAEQGMTAFSIDYRLADEDGQAEGHQIADCCQDCLDAAAFLLDHAEKFGIDLNRVSILGESAGGHLAGYVAASFRRPGFQFRRAFLVNPLTDLTRDDWQIMVPRHSSHPLLAGLQPEQFGKALSPLFLFTAQACPVTLLHGEADSIVPPAHSQLLYDRLTQLDVPADLHWMANTDHAFLLAEYTPFQSACYAAVRIIHKYLTETG